jgi:hypothetical protein
VLCNDLPLNVIGEACRKLADQGYQQLDALQEAKDGRNEWVDFADRVQIPDVVIHRLAQKFGPPLPSARDIMTKQDRLDAELRGWFGDYDNIASVKKIEDEKGERGWYQSRKMFLIHDTTMSFAERVCEEGHLKAQQANDTAYDGHLAYGEAPAVVFFQASDFGENKSIYPRQTRDGKRRFLVPPQQLAIHTNSFLMYFVKISESRRSDGDDSTILQLHVLFLPATHAKRAFCDEHFLMVNKQTFQPFHYVPKERQWKGFTGKKGTGHVDGRGVMVNVCVAQDVPINLPVRLFQGIHPWRLAVEIGGIIAPPRLKEPQICMFWLQGICNNPRCEYSHVSWYAFDSSLKEIWPEVPVDHQQKWQAQLQKLAANPTIQGFADFILEICDELGQILLSKLPSARRQRLLDSSTRLRGGRATRTRRFTQACQERGVDLQGYVKYHKFEKMSQLLEALPGVHVERKDGLGREFITRKAHNIQS